MSQPAPRISARPKRRGRNRMLWMPREHGAWAWLVIPLAAGVLVAGPSVYQLPLSVSAFGGYFFFNAASWWAKMPPLAASRRSCR